MGPFPAVDSLRVDAFQVPTDRRPESDGTFTWSATSIVVVRASTGGRTGTGYSYTHAAAARLIHETFRPLIEGRDVMRVEAAWDDMLAASRNMGRGGVAASARSAVDVALWDLKARLLDVPLSTLFGRRRDAVPIYGSGGLTSYSVPELRQQLGDWAEAGIRAVKMKVGREPDADPERVAEARDAIGPEVALFVDANGALSRKRALALADEFSRHGVVWFEEPVSSDDLDGLRLVRDRAPAGMEVAAGEYGWSEFHFRDLIRAGAVDVLQPDATRCGGFTGFRRVAELCRAHHIPISSHTAPQLHAHVCAAAPGLRHLEYFHDHVRIETMLFDGVLEPRDGALHPDPERPGMGIELREADADRFRI
jgi:L-alanine-DL-glutamate epimerase-like enolase superfamily enzyme